VDNGDSIAIEDGIHYRIKTELDESSQVVVKVYREETLTATYPQGTRIYPVVKNNNRLPVMFINLPEQKEIDDIERNDWMEGATYQLCDGERQLQEGITFGGKLDIKGRGNTTWNDYSKKPYSIRLEQSGKRPFLGMAAQRHWVLLANRLDCSFLRNSVTFKMGEIFNSVGWTPHSQQIELFINGEYRGLYELAEQIRIDENRVNIEKISAENPDGGYIIELVNSLVDEPYFRTWHNRTGAYTPDNETTSTVGVNLKDPDQNLETHFDEYLNQWISDDIDPELGRESLWTIIKNKVLAAEESVFSGNWQDADEGYKKYFDVPSMADFYLINEFVKNPDADHGSVFLSYQPLADKFFFGPIWDFDLTMGNYYEGNWRYAEDFKVKDECYWILQIIQDDYFKTFVRTRWSEKSAELNSLLAFIDSESEYIREARERDYEKHGITYYMNIPADDFDESIQILRDFVEKRIQWLNDHINEL
jgi:hypothetical protein